MSYSAEISRGNPSCFVFLLDQSGSMSELFGGEHAQRKADFVADVVNRTIHDLVIRCTKTEEIRNYYYVSIVGYGGSVGPGFSGNWMDPVANGGTPMCQAFSLVRQILDEWLSEHRVGFPPTVLHLTDGESTDGDPTNEAREILKQSTSDGQVLLMNCHVSARHPMKVEFPSDDSVLPDEFARMLFSISSVLPGPFQRAATDIGLKMAEGTRGFVFNGDPVSVVQFFEIGTRPANLR